MALTDAENETVRALDRHGPRLGDGRPCECGEDTEFETTTRGGYSDSLFFEHTCLDCGNEFETFLEG